MPRVMNIGLGRLWVTTAWLLAAGCGSPQNGERGGSSPVERPMLLMPGVVDASGVRGPSRPLEMVPVDPGAGGPLECFLISRFEVTNREYWCFVRATGYDGKDHPSSKPSEPFLATWKDGVYPPGQENHPACGLNVHHAKAYCAWLSKETGLVVRLPTDAEWELAARGPEGRAYPWGNDWQPGRANIGGVGEGDAFEESAPVGSFPRGATPGFLDRHGVRCGAGIEDMAGNIWEWTQEEHLRGGPWCMKPDSVRSDSIAREDTERADDKFGFRVVVELPRAHGGGGPRSTFVPPARPMGSRWIQRPRLAS